MQMERSGVEGNARLTGSIGLVLVVRLAVDSPFTFGGLPAQ